MADSKFAEQDVAPVLDPNAPFWKNAPSITTDRDGFGKTVPNHRTEVRSRWTKNNLYLLFICHYEQLHLHPAPSKNTETNQLWNWDVAEAFIGSDFKNIQRYKEFELSPQGEWVDLDIDLNNPHKEDGWKWNSKFEVAASISEAAKIWYGFMRIPYSSIDTKPARAGNTLRINFYRGQGPLPALKEIAWQPTYNASFHIPKSFGTLRLID